MKPVNIPVLSMLLLTLVCSCSKRAGEINVLVITGGHRYDTTEFLDVFRSLEHVAFDTLIQPHANDVIASEETGRYDVLVFYDMWQKISGPEKTAYRKMWESGKGMVFLHHSLYSYPEWTEFSRVLGGRHYRPESEVGSAGGPDYRHGLDLEVKVEDPGHPVCSGVSDFTIHDEGYRNIEIDPGVHLFLGTVDTFCTPYAGWANEYEQSRIVYLLLGHDRHAYQNASYRKLVGNAIGWAAGKSL